MTVSPTTDDRVAAALSEGIGGPVGRRAGRHPWWTPVRVLLLLTAVTMSLGMVQKSGCYKGIWFYDSHQYTHMCYSDLPYLYTQRGLDELDWPYSQDPGVRARYEVMEYPVGISYFAYGAAWVTHWVTGSPDLEGRKKVDIGTLESTPQVQREIRWWVVIHALVFAALALLSAWLLAGVDRRRPWDATLFAASPMLALTALINWDMLAVAMVAGAVFTWARGRPVATGVLLGLGTATKLYPLFLAGALLVICVRERRWRELAQVVLAGFGTWVLVNAPGYLSGPDQWHVFWRFNAERGPDLGSIWLVMSGASHHSIAAHTVNVWSWVFFGAWCVGVLLLGLAAPATPRFAQLGFLIVTGFLLINKVYSPQYVLWLLPLAVLARPRWRDQIVWQACELLYFASVWWYLADDLIPGRGSDPGFYWIAIIVRMLGELYLAAVVVRDIWVPRHDPVRQPAATAGQRERGASALAPTAQVKPAGERSGGVGFA